jgi:hypothetical protein
MLLDAVVWKDFNVMKQHNGFAAGLQQARGPPKMYGRSPSLLYLRVPDRLRLLSRYAFLLSFSSLFTISHLFHPLSSRHYSLCRPCPCHYEKTAPHNNQYPTKPHGHKSSPAFPCRDRSHVSCCACRLCTPLPKRPKFTPPSVH